MFQNIHPKLRVSCIASLLPNRHNPSGHGLEGGAMCPLVPTNPLGMQCPGLVILFTGTFKFLRDQGQDHCPRTGGTATPPGCYPFYSVPLGPGCWGSTEILPLSAKALHWKERDMVMQTVLIQHEWRRTSGDSGQGGVPRGAGTQN